MEDRNIKKKRSNFWLGLLIGMVISSIVSLLYAPRSGAEMRTAIKQKATETSNRTVDMINKARSKMAELKNKTEKKAEEFQSRAKEEPATV